MINIVRKDFNLPLVFSPCLCEYLCPPESDQFCIAGRTKCAKSAQWTIYWTLTLSSRLPIWRILHVSCCLWCRIGQIPRQRGGVSTSRRPNPEALETTWNGTWIFLEAFGGFCKFPPVVQNWWHSPPERSVPTSCRSDAEALETTWTRTWIFLEAATGRTDDQLWPACKGDLATWPPDHLATWPADQAGTLLAEHLTRLLLKRKGFWGKPVGFYLIHRKKQVSSERSLTFTTLRLELETWDTNTFQSKSLLGKVVLEPIS